VAETGWGASAGDDPDRWQGGRSPNGGADGGRAPDQDEMEHLRT
jgi:hypothetical protein